MRFKIALIYVAMAALLAIAVSTQAQNRPTPLLPNPGIAQATEQTQPVHKYDATPLSTYVCTYSFSTGSGATYMDFCVTVNGTLANFQSPAGVEMLNPQGVVNAWEGYGICDESTGISYWDYNYSDSGNWNLPTTLSTSASSVKIQRTTSDGLWTVTNTISKVAGPPPYAKVVMAVKNESAITKDPIIVRFGGFLPDQAGSSGNGYENYDGSINSVWGFNSYSDDTKNSGAPYGMMLQNVQAPTPSSTYTSWYGVPQDLQTGPNPCNPLANYIGTITYGMGSGFIEYFPVLAKDKTVTITEKYFAF